MLREKVRIAPRDSASRVLISSFFLSSSSSRTRTRSPRTAGEAARARVNVLAGDSAGDRRPELELAVSALRSPTAVIGDGDGACAAKSRGTGEARRCRWRSHCSLSFSALSLAS